MMSVRSSRDMAHSEEEGSRAREPGRECTRERRVDETRSEECGACGGRTVDYIASAAARCSAAPPRCCFADTARRGLRM